MFDGFAELDVRVNGVRLRGRVGGDPARPPLLLVHGFPESHLIWHRMAPSLARDFFVVAPDLRGYGASERPPATADHSSYSKREMARDCVALLAHLGHERFAVVGHDRGARVTARLAADHPDRVTRAMLLDIAPTLDMYEATSRAFATAYWHWFFLIQEGGLPERMILADPEWFIREIHARWAADVARLDPDALTEYVRRFTPDVVWASCADYRAAAGVDLTHDDADADRPLDVPLHVLWGSHGAMDRLYDVQATWESTARQVTGAAIDGGHFIAEENPAATLAELTGFLAAGA